MRRWCFTTSPPPGKRGRSEDCEVWKAEPLIARLHKCKVMLLLHGVLTDAESNKVHGRLMKKAGRLPKPKGGAK